MCPDVPSQCASSGTTPPEILAENVKQWFGGPMDVYKLIVIIMWIILISYLAYKAIDDN